VRRRPSDPSRPRWPGAGTRRRRRLPRDTREQLIAKEAVRFFAEFGFGGRTRELARRLGVTQPLLYRYFPSKAALIDRVYEEVYLNRWKPEWEALLDDRSIPLPERLTRFYQDYARSILSYEWVRIFLFSGLEGVSINRRYLKLVRDRIFLRVAREIRAAYGLPRVRRRDVVEGETELVWALHASIFYIGVRKWVYGLPVPRDIDAAVARKVRAFLEGFPRAVAGLPGRWERPPRRGPAAVLALDGAPRRPLLTRRTPFAQH
jgi:AcrR family transcriptional regulator